MANGNEKVQNFWACYLAGNFSSANAKQEFKRLLFHFNILTQSEYSVEISVLVSIYFIGIHVLKLKLS